MLSFLYNSVFCVTFHGKLIKVKIHVHAGGGDLHCKNIQKEQLHYHICITATISVFDFKMTQLQLS